MPHRPPHPCSVPGCAALVSRGARCPDHVRALQREADSFRPSAARRGYDHRWRQIRLAHLRREPVCRSCGSGVRLHVDHIDGNAKNCRSSNLRTLCHSCHSRRTARDQGFARRRAEVRR